MINKELKYYNFIKGIRMGNSTNSPEKIYIPSENIYAMNNYKDHTKTKHKVLRKYLEKWFTILSKYYNVNYIDGFSGCGVYTDNGSNFYPGSPIIAAQAWNKAVNKNNKLSIICIEKEKKILENLKKAYSHFCEDLEYKVKPIFINGDFDNEINKILDCFDKDDKIEPSFFFIDPYGFKIKYDIIKRISSIPKTEILFTFMYDSINRFFNNPNLEKTFNDLFGTTNWKAIMDFSDNGKESKLIDLYRDNLKNIYNYVLPYRFLYPDKDRTIYYLIHMTNHIKGVSIMKSCFAEINEGEVTYLGKSKDQLSIMNVNKVKTEGIKIYLLDNYKNKEITFNDIISENIDSTPYLEKDFRKVLKELRDEGKVKVEHISSKRSDAIKEKDLIIFN